jgi:hypothetical protein
MSNRTWNFKNNSNKQMPNDIWEIYRSLKKEFSKKENEDYSKKQLKVIFLPSTINNSSKVELKLTPKK